ncbi:hypothetical protein [Peribacillus sp. NPDC096448]|uniref:hypothetical protein n=1 Tax=Peribacillus sp. NPDC096448 TaxID=3364395 RepID=UPI0038067DCD
MKKKIIMWVTGVLVAIILLGSAGMTFYKYAPTKEKQLLKPLNDFTFDFCFNKACSTSK